MQIERMCAVVLYKASRLLDNKSLSLYLYFRNKRTAYSERKAWKLEGGKGQGPRILCKGTLGKNRYFM